MNEVTFEPMHEYGELIGLERFIRYVNYNAFNDYDGYGSLATETEISNIHISPSEVKGYEFPEWCTHIMWYNK